MTTPQTLGKYDILKTLGRGGMGTVYLGYDRKLHRHVAIKTILREELGGDDMPSEYAQRFELEAKAIAKLNHPNIVSVYDSGEEGDTAYIVMEFIEGNDLKYYFDNQVSFNLSESLRLIVDLLEALAHAHDKGVWHRDIKPANVMIDTTGQLKLTDFGVSRIADTSERSRTGTMVGTLHYMSPEQVQNVGVSHRSDLFAAAVILYQFLTRSRPFTGSEYEISRKIVNEDPIPPSQLNPALPPQIDAVLAKAMAKQPDRRYANAREFIAALRSAVGEKQEPLLDVDATRHFYASHGSKNSTALDPNPASRRSKAGSGSANGTGNGSASASSRATTPGVDLGLTSPSEHAEIEFWRSIKDGNDVDEFALYLTRFPNGTYAALARKRIEKMSEGSGVSGPGLTGSGQTGSHAAPFANPHSGTHSGTYSAQPVGPHSATRGNSGSIGSSVNIGPAAPTFPSMSAGSGSHGTSTGAGMEKREPTFGDFSADSAPPSASPTGATPAAPRQNWQMPVAIVAAAALIAGGLWLTRTPPTPVSTGTGIITPAPANNPINNPINTPANNSANNFANNAAGATGVAGANATPAAPSARPAAVTPGTGAIAGTVVPPPANPANDAAAEKLLEKQRLDAMRLEAQHKETLRLEAMRVKEAALQEKAKREEAAATKAREAIAAANPDAAKAAARPSGASHNCPLVGNMKAETPNKTEAELCTAAKNKANAWIASWKTPDGIAKGRDKFSDPAVGDCKCQTTICRVEVSYFGPCE